jgi:hypothetical protein
MHRKHLAGKSEKEKYKKYSFFLCREETEGLGK